MTRLSRTEHATPHVMTTQFRASASGGHEWSSDGGRTWVAATSSAPSFGDRISEALRREDDVIPHPVTRPSTPEEIERLWQSIVDVGRGG